MSHLPTQVTVSVTCDAVKGQSTIAWRTRVIVPSTIQAVYTGTPGRHSWDIDVFVTGHARQKNGALTKTIYNATWYRDAKTSSLGFAPQWVMDWAHAHEPSTALIPQAVS